MIMQITLTVPEAKGIIAKATAALPEIKEAMKAGRIFLKGGTTVSALAQELVGSDLYICGRISPRGTKGPRSMDFDVPHSILIDNGNVKSIDDWEDAEIERLQKRDVFVVGANAIDRYGNAAMMAGSFLGGPTGRILGGLMAEGINIIILASLEKLIPTTISEAVKACGRRKTDISFGMAVGLIPLMGRLITEQTAIELLADVKCTIVGRGGIKGAEGATTMVVEGEKKQIHRVYEYVQSVKGFTTFGSLFSQEECKCGSSGCKDELACIYKKPLKSDFWSDCND